MESATLLQVGALFALLVVRLSGAVLVIGVLRLELRLCTTRTGDPDHTTYVGKAGFF
jgi:hypothetical protein